MPKFAFRTPLLPMLNFAKRSPLPDRPGRESVFTLEADHNEPTVARCTIHANGGLNKPQLAGIRGHGYCFRGEFAAASETTIGLARSR